MKKLAIPCNFGGQKQPVDFYVGDPKEENHPIQNQANWLGSARGGSVPGEVMDSLKRLQDLAIENKVPFEDLCSYAINSAASEVTGQIPEQKQGGAQDAAAQGG